MKNKYSYMIGAPILILVLWFLLTFFKVINPLFLASPQSVFFKLMEFILNGILIYDLIATLIRVLSAFLIALLIGIPLGLLMGYFDKIYYSLEFIVDFFRSLPATALFPLFLLFFGVGDIAKILVASWSASLIILINSLYGARLSKKVLINAAKTMEIKGYSLFKKILFPSALPHIFTGARISISLILAIVVITEMFIGTNVGLGHRILDAQMIYNTPLVYSTIFLVGIIGYLMNRLFISLEKKVLHWS